MTATFIGFGTRSSTILENRFQYQDSFPEGFNVVSSQTSEVVRTITFSVIGQRTAEVVPENQAYGIGSWDVAFGQEEENSTHPPFVIADLPAGSLMLAQDLQLLIHNDFNVEKTEFFTLRITSGHEGRDVFECYDDTEEPIVGDFFCSHTFYIVDTDGMLQQCVLECLCANRQCSIILVPVKNLFQLHM